MNRYIKQQGSAHVIIIVILVVVILGLLGYVLWQNLTKDDDGSDVAQTTQTNTSKNESTTQQDSSVKLVEKDFMSSDNLGIRYKVPETWTGGKYGGGDTLSDSESTTLTAPDGLTVTMTISRLVRGWTPDSLMSNVLDVQTATGTALTWLVVDAPGGTAGPLSLQIANGSDIPAVGGQKVAGSSIYKLGDAEGMGVYLEMQAGYNQNMSLEEFNAKEAVKQAKAMFESVTIGI